ncbi:MAG: hypothetical protein FJ096_14695 [Deltaproteobacteria bacterium]|nr:hypothetical protein [Deltaproteobacteria bacterium]
MATSTLKRSIKVVVSALMLLNGACAVRTDEVPPTDPAANSDACEESPLGCAKDESALGGPALEARPDALDYVIHVGGVCSTSFTTGGGGKSFIGHPGKWPGFVSIDAPVNQLDSMATAVEDLTQVLDAFCTGESFCHLFGYSNGAAVISETLSIHDQERWNVVWVLTTAGNEGGSELSESGVSGIGEMVGMSCGLAGTVGPSDHRSAWNHHDTGGALFYGMGGYQEYWYTGSFPDFFGDGANDGIIAMHSSAGLAQAYHIPDDEPWMCWAEESYYANHRPAFDCHGFDANHSDMKMLGIEKMGGL